jgi:uncharacterized protein with HEPN domain
VRLLHIRDAAQHALKFADGVAREEFEANRMLIFALERCLEIVGEAAGQLSEEVWAAAPDIPWKQILGMREWLAHAYFAINLDILWKTVEVDLEPLLATVERLLTAEPTAEA